MDQDRIILVIHASDIPDLNLDETDTDSDSFRDIIHDYLTENYGEFPGEIGINVNGDIIAIEWAPESDPSIEADLQKAMQILSGGDLQEAKRFLEDLEVKAPDNPIVRYNLGMCYSDLGYLDFAIDTLSICVELAPLYSNAYVALGVAYARKNMLDESETSLIRAVELDKNNAFAYRNLAGISGKKGDYANSAKYFKLAHDLDPENPHILYGLGLSYQNLGMQDDATVYYEKLIDIGTPVELVELAKEGLDNLARAPVIMDEIRPDGVFYCLSALEIFEPMNPEEIKNIAFEIAMKGTSGLDINDPDQKYTLDSLPGKFSGFYLTCCMYVGFQMIDPTLDVGIDLSKEYNSAKQMHKMHDHI